MTIYTDQIGPLLIVLGIALGPIVLLGAFLRLKIWSDSHAHMVNGSPVSAITLLGLVLFAGVAFYLFQNVGVESVVGFGVLVAIALWNDYGRRR